MSTVRSSTRPWTHLAVLASYFAVAVIYAFPLVRRFATHLPSRVGAKDVFGFAWNNWWTYHAVTQLHVRPYITDYIFLPFQLDLRLHTFGLLYGLFSIPLMPLLGPVAVLNLQVLVTIVLNGFATFRLVHHLTGRVDTSFVSGLLIASVPAINFHLAVGRPSCAAFWPAIMALYFGLLLLDDPSPSCAVRLALSLAAMLLADQQIVMFGGFWLLVLGIHAVLRRRHDLMNRRVLFALVGVLLAVAPFVYILYVRPLSARLGYDVPGRVEALTYSYPAWFFARPALVWSVYGAVLPAALFAACFYSRKRPTLWPWIVGSLAFVVLSMGPVLQGTRIPLPFALVHRVPGFAQFRTPYRFQIPAALGLAVAAGLVLSFALEVLDPKVGRRLVVAVSLLIVGDLVAHQLAKPFEVQSMPARAIYAEIARDPVAGAVLEVPLGVRTGTDRVGPGEELSFYQPVHRRRMVNGFAARAPLAALEYYRASPALMLLANEPPPPGDPRADLRRRLGELGVRYVVVHPELIGTDRRREIVELLRGVPELKEMSSEREVIAFRRDGSQSSHVGVASGE